MTSLTGAGTVPLAWVVTGGVVTGFAATDLQSLPLDQQACTERQDHQRKYENTAQK